MGILDRILSGAGQLKLGLRSNRNDSGPESQYPHPEAYDRTLGVYEVKLRYQDGSDETVKCYTKPKRDSDTIVLRLRPKMEYTMQIGDPPVLDYDTRQISYYVLARDPIERQIGTETIRVQYIRTGERSYDASSTRLRHVSRSVEEADR